MPSHNISQPVCIRAGPVSSAIAVGEWPCSTEAQPFPPFQEYGPSNFVLSSLHHQSFPFHRIIPGQIHDFISPILKHTHTHTHTLLSPYLPILLPYFKTNLWWAREFCILLPLTTSLLPPPLSGRHLVVICWTHPLYTQQCPIYFGICRDAI